MELYARDERNAPASIGCWYPQVRPNKYKAKKTVIDGYTFASGLEARRYNELKLLVRAGAIRDLEMHPVFPITINGHHICKVILDFKYVDVEHKETVYEDTKGIKTALSSLKKKLVSAQYGIKVNLIYDAG